MEGFRRSMEVGLVLVMVMLAMVFPEASATKYTVGGNMGWATNVNYTIWAQGKHFYNGDWLFFVYDRNQMNVLEVNKTDYELCNSEHPLKNWTRGAGRDVVPLNETRHYYIISGKGFCYSGMKLALLVENAPPPLVENAPSPLVENAPSPLIENAPSPRVENAPSPPVENAPSPPVASPEKSGSPKLPFSGKYIVLSVFAIGAMWDAFVWFW